MPANEPAVELPKGVRLQLLPPRSRRIRNHKPEWDSWLGSVRIGRIEQWTVSSSPSVFYRATAVHPSTGVPIPLESNTDLAERFAKVVAAWNDPARFIHKSSWG